MKPSRLRRTACVLLLALALAGCGNKKPPVPPSQWMGTLSQVSTR